MSQNSSGKKNIAWAKLVSTNSALDNIELVKNSHVFPKHRLHQTHNSLIPTNVQISRDVNNCFWLVDYELSTTRQLNFGDKIFDYIFCPNPTECNQLKRSRQQPQDQPSEQKKSQITENSSRKMQQQMTCSICLGHIYCCVTVVPCLHNFCGACLSDWIRDSEVCPYCRNEFNEVRKNGIVNNMVEIFVESNPHLKRSAEELQAKDARNIIKDLFKKVTYLDGSIYRGNIVDGKREGKGKYVEATGFIYEGEWINDKKEGRGTAKYTSGGVYEGEFHDGVREGSGKYIYSNGDVYDGKWIKNSKEGRGVMKRSDGAVYDGEWLEGKKQGEGTMSWPNGAVYKGEWANDMAEGKGKMAWPDGSVYDGYWKEGREVAITLNNDLEW